MALCCSQTKQRHQSARRALLFFVSACCQSPAVFIVNGYINFIMIAMRHGLSYVYSRACCMSGWLQINSNVRVNAAILWTDIATLTFFKVFCQFQGVSIPCHTTNAIIVIKNTQEAGEKKTLY